MLKNMHGKHGSMEKEDPENEDRRPKTPKHENEHPRTKTKTPKHGVGPFFLGIRNIKLQDSAGKKTKGNM